MAEQYAQEVFLANSYKLKAFAKRHKKTDKIDARLIAHILQKGFLPVVTIPDLHTRQIREVLRYQLNLVTDCLRNIFRLKALLDKLGHFSAALIKSEIINISRFASFNRLCAYAGLAPRVSASANKIFHGPLNTNRRNNLQWILLENVFHFLRAIPKAQKKYVKLKQCKGHTTAKVVLARDMLKIIYHVLKEQRPFYFEKKESQIQSVEAPALCEV